MDAGSIRVFMQSIMILRDQAGAKFQQRLLLNSRHESPIRAAAALATKVGTHTRWHRAYTKAIPGIRHIQYKTHLYPYVAMLTPSPMAFYMYLPWSLDIKLPSENLLPLSCQSAFSRENHDWWKASLSLKGTPGKYIPPCQGRTKDGQCLSIW